MESLLDKIGAFAKAQPADKKYDYRHPKECALAQFALAEGYADQYYGLTDEKKLMNPEEGYMFTEAEIYAATKPHTFGAFAERIEKRVHADKFGEEVPA